MLKWDYSGPFPSSQVTVFDAISPFVNVSMIFVTSVMGGYTTLIGASTPTGSIKVEHASATKDAYYFVYVQQFGGNISLNDVQIYSP